MKVDLNFVLKTLKIDSPIGCCVASQLLKINGKTAAFLTTGQFIECPIERHLDLMNQFIDIPVPWKYPMETNNRIIVVVKCL